MTQEELKQLFESDDAVDVEVDNTNQTDEISVSIGVDANSEPLSQDDLKSLYDEAEKKETTFEGTTLSGGKIEGLPKTWQDRQTKEIQAQIDKARPLYQEEKDALGIAEVTSSVLLSAGAGAYKIPLGMGAIMQDIVNSAHNILIDDGDKEDWITYFTEKIKDNNEIIDKVNKELGYTGDEMLTPDLIGQIMGELATLPVAVLGATKGLRWMTKGREAISTAGKTKVMPTITEASVAEFPVAFASAKGEGATTEEAVKSGLISAGATKVGGEILLGLGKFIDDPAIVKNLLLGKSSDKQAYEHLIRKSGETQASLNKANEEYAISIGKNVDELTYADKVNALLNNTPTGAKFKVQAEYYGEGVLARINNNEEKLGEIFKKVTKDGDLKFAADEFTKYVDNTKATYGEIEKIFLDNFNNRVNIPKDKLTKFINDLEKTIKTTDDQTVVNIIKKDLVGKDGVLIEDILNTIHRVNSKTTKGVQGERIKDFLDEYAKKGLGDDGFELWKDLNAKYADMKMLSDEHPIGKLFAKLNQPNFNLSEADIADEILKIEYKGKETFASIQRLLGPETASNVEKAIVNKLINKTGVTSKTIENINRFEFSTPSGKMLQEEINRVSGLVSDVDAKKLLNKFIGGTSGSGVGWSDNLVSKFKYSIIGKIWDNAVSRLPSGSEERALRTIADIVKNTDINVAIKEVPLNTLQNIYNEQIKIWKDRISMLRQDGMAMNKVKSKEIFEMQKNIKLIEKKLKNMPKLLEHKKIDAYVSGRGTISGSMEASAKADEFARAKESRLRGGNYYNPKGTFQDIPFLKKEKKLVDTTIEPDI